MIKKSLQTFFKSQIAVGICLLIATIFALFLSNSGSYQAYSDFFSTNLPLNLNFIGIYKNLTLLEWINDCLMAIFFLLVGMELKREMLIGELSSRQKASLPIIAACGGVIVPLLIFIFLNRSNVENMRGFAIPCATDIAFAYGIISLFGKTISNSIKIFVVALAVIDDLIAILIIAFFYSNNLDLAYLFYAILVISILAFLNFMQVRKIHFYLFFGVILWLMVLKSGLHASLAGVLLALFIPLQVKNEAVLAKLASNMAPAVNFLILPIFAFANAGVRIENFSADLLLNPLVISIVCGLFLGKQIGVMLFSFIAVKMKISSLPRGANWLEFYVAAIFTGIGFTMSLFIGSLAFFGMEQNLSLVKIGVLIGSILSVIYGSFIIFLIKIRTK
jgi:NhaA family Na+:H+ antiporter